ncbi:MAG: RNA-binding protein [Rhodospirillales bacterium]|nr:RNA-binding protein [Rhodospirillales bacterium]
MGSKGRTATQPDPETSPDEPEHGPLRRCLVSRAQGRREEMLRFVAAPDGALVFDSSATLPGRGLWLSADGDVIELAVRRGVFARAARAPLKLPQDLRSQVEAALARRLVDLLGLARRSGAAISGFEKAREWLQAGRGGLIVQAADGSADERARFVGGSALPCVVVLSAGALGKVFGREHTVHVVIAAGRLARMIELEARRLLGVAKESVSGQ